MSKIKTRASFNSTDFEIMCNVAKKMNLSVEDYIAAATLSMTAQILSSAEARQNQAGAKEAPNGEAINAEHPSVLPLSDIPTGTP